MIASTTPAPAWARAGPRKRSSAAHPEIQCVGGADPVRARHADDDADADLAVRAAQDVLAMTLGVHPRVDGAARRGVRAGAPGEVLAERPALIAADVARTQDAVHHRHALRRRV